MKLGRFTIEQLNEGQFELFPDGKINRAPVSETETEAAAAGLGDRNLVGINPTLVTDGSIRLLIDTGLGWGMDAGSSYREVSSIRTNLDIFGLSPADITHVVLTHLHYDHAAGLSYTDAEAVTRPTFPNARCLLQRSEWDHAARQAAEADGQDPFYRLDDLYRLYADGLFELRGQNETEVAPGIRLIHTGGHTPGHQIVRLCDGGKVAYCLGDLIPTGQHLNSPDPPGNHVHFLDTKKARRRLLQQAFEEEAYLCFYHSLSAKACRVTLDQDENYVLREV